MLQRILLSHFPAHLYAGNGSRGHERAFREMLWASEASACTLCWNACLFCAEATPLLSAARVIHSENWRANLQPLHVEVFFVSANGDYSSHSLHRVVLCRGLSLACCISSAPNLSQLCCVPLVQSTS